MKNCWMLLGTALFATALGSVGWAQDRIEPIVSDFTSEVRNDSRFQLLDSPADNGRLEFADGGLQISTDEDSDDPDSLAGFVLASETTSYFTCNLKFRCNELSTPRRRLETGLVMSLQLGAQPDDGITIGYISSRGVERALAIWRNIAITSEIQKLPPPDEVKLVDLEKGNLLIHRERNQISINVSESGVSYRAMGMVPCGLQELQQLRVLLLHPGKSEKPASFLVQGMSFSGDSYYDQPPPPTPFWTVPKIVSIAVLLSIVTTAIVLRESIKDWILSRWDN